MWFSLAVFEYFLFDWFWFWFFVGFAFVGGQIYFSILMRKEIIGMENCNSDAPRVLVLLNIHSIIAPYSTILLEHY